MAKLIVFHHSLTSTAIKMPRYAIVTNSKHFYSTFKPYYYEIFIETLKQKFKIMLPYVNFQCLYILYLQFTLTGTYMYVYTR